MSGKTKPQLEAVPIHDLLPPAEPLIDVNDFKSIEVIISLRNNFSKTEILPKMDPETGQIATPIRLIEFTETEMRLSIPQRTCAQGHHVDLEFMVINARHDLHFKTTAKIEKVTHSKDDQTDEIWVSLAQYDENEWQKFRDLFANRQNDIEEFFRAVKGT